MCMPTLCVFGASSTWGAWDLEKGGWVNRLRLWVDKKNRASTEGEFYWEVYNLGVSGDTTADVLVRFKAELTAREAGAVIISIGDNDTVYDQSPGKPRLTEDQFASNIEEMLALATAATDKVVVLGLKQVTEAKVQPVPWNTQANYRNASIQAYDQRLKKIAKEHGMYYVPMFDLLADDDLADGLHPNEQGHEKIFQRVKGFLEESGLLTGKPS